MNFSTCNIALVAIAACILAGGCSHSASADTSADADDRPSGAAANAGRPVIHFDQTSVLAIDGVPAEEDSYKKLVADCHKAGAPTTEISASDIEKIGRNHVEAWIGPDRSARHLESWSQNSNGPCKFVLEHKDEMEIAEASGKLSTIDNTAHTIEVQDVGADTAVGPTPADDAEESDADRAAGWKKESNQQANGAECSAWKHESGQEVCVWTGGGKWGYSSNGANALDSDGHSSGGLIVLWAHPGKGSSWRLDTKSFDVGQPLPAEPFKIPSGLATKHASN